MKFGSVATLCIVLFTILFTILFTKKPLCLPAACCTKDTRQEAVASYRIQHRYLHELSGLVVSRKNPNWTWVHNDRGNGPFLYALQTGGKKTERRVEPRQCIWVIEEPTLPEAAQMTQAKDEDKPLVPVFTQAVSKKAAKIDLYFPKGAEPDVEALFVLPRLQQSEAIDVAANNKELVIVSEGKPAVFHVFSRPDQ